MKKLLILSVIMIGLNLLSGPSTNANAELDASPPTIGSEAAVMMEATTGIVLYENNGNKSMYPASLTKIATAIYAIETADLEESVTVSDTARNVEGTRVYLEPGEKVTLKKLLQGLLINSGNDAGVAIAEHLSGSINRFSEDLNQYLEENIGVENTHFENPHGLFHQDHVTTAKDLAVITQYALKNDLFKEIFGTRELKWDGESWDTTLYSHHKLFTEDPYQGVTGGKTGFVSESGFTLATTAERDGLKLIVITLNSNLQSIAYNDTKNLLDYGFDYFENSRIRKGKTFVLNNVEYIVGKDISFTHDKNEQITTEVKPDGTLELSDSDGTIISSNALVKVEKERDKAETNEGTNDRTVQINSVEKSSIISGYAWVAVIVVLIVTVSGTIYLKRKMNS